LAVTSNSLENSQLVLNGGTIEAWNGPVTVTCPVALDGDVIFGGNQPLIFNGVATLSGDRTFYVDNTTVFWFSIFGPPPVSIVDNGLGFGFTKAGPGTLVLAGLDSYGGETVLEAGTLEAGNNSSFGSGTLVLDGGTIEAIHSISNPVMLGGDFTIGGVGS